MNIAFFLKPKSETIYISTESSVRQTLEKMEHHSYTAVPIIDEGGKYVGTITEGDLLWYLKQKDFPDLFMLEDASIMAVVRRVQNKSVPVHAEIEELLELATNQNFVPVVDDQGTYIGIVTRKTILQFFYEKFKK
ncbi:MAG: CBS domain-containing protein [Desulfobacterales bacterium]|uniref:CBS domain-containing protein n=1 Tax=Clostridium sp. 'deep sea' TaxID=2779445 RepID=UPI0018969148|nr:CBS domain-containing protein [Clostridium sp. 'deep sea']MCG8551473.1 CBS domain-containing protein [Desulfobacterales bacterium]QOR36253.1 CBS domain-containing protein [Clostridium sp. 'deep sea']